MYLCCAVAPAFVTVPVALLPISTACSKPPRILIAGMERSGSTWLFLATSKLVEVAKGRWCCLGAVQCNAVRLPQAIALADANPKPSHPVGAAHRSFRFWLQRIYGVPAVTIHTHSAQDILATDGCFEGAVSKMRCAGRC